MVVLVTAKNEEDPIKNVRTRVLTTHSINVSDIQGQLTPQSAMGHVLNSSAILCFFTLLRRRMKIPS